MKKFSKRLLTFVLACAMVFGLSGMTAFAAEEEDPGISTLDAGDEYEPNYDWYIDHVSPYEISSAEDLVGLSNIVNGTAPANVGTNSFNGETINVNAINGVIDMNEATVDWEASDNDGVVNIDKTVDGALVFTPIGNLENPFEGTFDGNGVLIKDLYVTSDDGCLGLFGAVGSKDAAQEGACGTVENFSLTGIVECTGGNSTTQKDFVGGAVGRLYAGGTIEYVTNEHLLVDAPGTDNVGGIVGFAGTPTGEGYANNPSVDNTSVSCCENKATIRAYYKVAGIVGENAATVKYCCNSGWIMCRRNTGQGAGVAGIVGRNGNNNTAAEEALVAYCYNTGPITNNGRNDDSATNTIRGYAGICGTTYGATGKVETHNCYNVGAIPTGYGQYNSITNYIEGGAAVAVRDNYTPSDLVNVSIFNAGDSTQEYGDMTYTVEQFKVSSRDDNEVLAKLGVYFEPDYEADEDAINDHYPILFWQAGEKEPEITDLRIETPPKKTAYNGEVFDPTGMVVIATYSNGAEMEIPCSYVTYNDSTYTLSDGYTYDTEKEISADETQFPITFEGWTLNVPVNNSEEDTPPLNDKGQYVLDSVTDLEWFADQVNNETYDGHNAIDAIVAADIDASESESLEPIGPDYMLPFNGTFDGDGHVITVNLSGSKNVGLFGCLCDENASVSNLTVAGSVSCEDSTGYAVAGGIVGEIDAGSVTGCVNEADVTSTGGQTGGVVGYVYADNCTVSITNCTNIGSVSGTSSVGGIVGQTEDESTTIDGCLNYGFISGDDINVGGIVGYLLGSSSVTNCGNEGSVKSSQHYVGGIAGQANNTNIKISSCYNKGDIEGEEYCVAGIIGYDYQDATTTIDSCYNMGTITASAGSNTQASGGIVGASANAALTNIYNTGTVTATYGGALLGGGIATSSSVSISNGYYLVDSAADAVATGAAGTITTNDVASKTADEIKSADFLKLLTDAGGDFKAGCGHPILTWETAEHTWGDVTWDWSADNTEATASRTCEDCGMVETVDAQVATDSTAAGERTVGKTAYTATATFEDGTTVTDEKDVFTPATGSIAIEINKGGDEPVTSELAYSTINEAMDNTEPQTFTYTSGGGTNEVTKPFVTISSLLDIDDTIDDVCCYHVIADMPDNYYETYLPTKTCLYYRDDSLIYRTAVDDSDGSMWVDNPTTIEVNYVHDWGDLTWNWSADYSEATVTGSCQRSVCKKYGVKETANATVTSTTTATATKDGETTYTATATFSDGTEVTDTVTVDQNAYDPDGYITVMVNGESMEIANTTIDAAIEAADTKTIANSSGSEVTAKFVKLSDLIGISEEDFTSFTVTDSDDAVTEDLPTDTYLYWRDDRACYRIAVEGGARNLWRDDPTTIEVVGFETVDKTNLDATIEEAKELNEADYTAESWDALQAVLADAEEVSASIVATQDAVDKAEESLKEAIDNLVPTAPADKDALEAAIEEAKDLVESDYSDGWDAFEAALDAAETVDSSTDVSQSAVDAATKALTDAMDALVAKTADKTALEEEIAAVETATQDLVPSDYTDESWAALEDALEAAKTTDEESDPLQSAVDKATDALADAMDALTAKTADKSALEDEIAAANDLVESDYTPESWAALTEALEGAMSVDESQNPLQSEVDAAAKALQDAMDALVAAPADKSILDTAITAAEALAQYQDFYTEDSWNALQDALTTAKEASENTNATQSSVNSATLDLVTAIGNLVPEQQPAAEVDKSVLDAAITAAEALNDYQSYYTEDSWNDLQSALSAAKDVSADPDATQDAVNEATVNLVAALADLQPADESGTGSTYTGFVKGDDGHDYYMENGVITGKKQGILKDTNNALGDAGAWYYVIDSEVQYSYTNLVGDFNNENGWWYIKDGKVDFTANTVAKNKNGWWYVTGGKVQFGFTGLANYKNENGWWYIVNGKVDFTHNGVDHNQNGWWYVTGGKVQFGFTGLAHYRNVNGWWYIRNGRVDFTYNGIASNQNGTWYLLGGKVQLNYTGTVTSGGTTYNVRNGKVS